jgi:hypothetical protein
MEAGGLIDEATFSGREPKESILQLLWYAKGAVKQSSRQRGQQYRDGKRKSHSQDRPVRQRDRAASDKGSCMPRSCLAVPHSAQHRNRSKKQ